jgi:hypothetical protein
LSPLLESQASANYLAFSTARRKTYAELFDERLKSHRPSRRYTSGAQFEHESEDPETQLAALFPPDYRRAKMKSYALWGLINIFIAGYLLYYIIWFWNDWEFTSPDTDCVADLSWWIWVYEFFHLAHIIRKSIVIIIWKVARDPTIACTKVDLISIPLIVLPELCWYVYGNIYVWDRPLMTSCRLNHEFFYYTVLALIFYGYVFMFMFLVVLFAALAVCCYFRIHG